MSTETYETDDYILKIKKWPGFTFLDIPHGDVKINFKKSEVKNILVAWKAGSHLCLITSGKNEYFYTHVIDVMQAVEQYDVEGNYERHLNATLACLQCVMTPEHAPDTQSWLETKEYLVPLLVALLSYIMKRHYQ